MDAGATTVNIPDTVGYAIPAEFGALTAASSSASAAGAVISVHCHNDLGLATANTLAAVQAGARQVEVTINGLGERAGNASLEEVVMALRTRPTQFGGGGSARPDRADQRRQPPGQLPDRLPGAAEQGDRRAERVRARVGHPPGRHAQEPADLRDHDPAVGRAGGQPPVGREALRPPRPPGQAARSSATSWRARRSTRSTAPAIALADAKKEVTDADLVALVEQQAAEGGPDAEARAVAGVQLQGWSVTSSHGGRSSGSVSLTLNGEARTADWSGNGPVDALFGAVDAAVEPVLGWHPSLTDYEIRAVSGGEDAQGQVLVRARRSSDEEGTADTATGHGLSTNIIEASLEAYLAALEKLLDERVTLVTYRIVLLPGDGIGPEVTAAATSVLEASRPTRTRRSRGMSGSSAARPSTHTGPRSATRTWPPAPPRTRSCSARSAVPNGTTRRRRSARSRRSSSSARALACSPTCGRSRSSRHSWMPRRSARSGCAAWTC